MTASKVLISIMPSNSIFDTIFIVRRRIEKARSLVGIVIEVIVGMFRLVSKKVKLGGILETRESETVEGLGM